MSKKTTTKKSPPSLSCDSEVVECVISSPIGNIGVTMCEEGLHSVGLKGDISDENFVPNEREVVELVGKDLGTKVLKDCLYWFQVYFKDPSLMSTVPRPNICCLGKRGPGFRARVWQTLADTVGPGEIITYGALSSRLGNPGAARAVGSAMRNNPIGFIVPCHRVVRSGGLGLYFGGKRQTVKKWLLRHEGVNKF
ncbi:methylated-DNA--protein-cysteine methyltransferase-like [Eriocheir sinensis]|uniref:methylated-DNA--protein-cysteine methyltransferase-like n=1 Tax=Eriocheir sinensis TaxID=95602 RepID=UPI0021C815E5|nr:methylated-DNA--protein-cysteine methyltransferase-like [Eriocheir sinensis]XP_050722398.1 methylated-DNA--protein-cysteine methyltransferase-like [Eriocheir sinensis]